MRKSYNFSAGPAMLPRPVLHEWQQLTAASPYTDSNITFMELGHRTPAFQAVVRQLLDDLRTLLNVPEHYHILLMPGGGRMQFATLAMNLMGRSQGGADYIETGLWSQQAIEEAKRFGHVHVAASAAQTNYTSIPEPSTWRLRPEAAYCHVVANETAHGLAFHSVPDTQGVPLVADMTSNLLAAPINVQDYGLLYAASQKNLGVTGFSVVIVRDDLLGFAMKAMPAQLDYQFYLNDPTPVTPVTFAIYVASLVTAWIKSLGGLEAMGNRNAEKAKRLYDFIDGHESLSASVQPPFRSTTNVLFQMHQSQSVEDFVRFAESQGLYGLAGHRSVGHLRASLYNAMDMEGVEALIACLQAFLDQG